MSVQVAQSVISHDQPSESLEGIRTPKAPFFEATATSYQRSLEVPMQGHRVQTRFPGVYRPAEAEASVDEVVDAIRKLAKQPAGSQAGVDQSPLRQLLTAHGGALHFRNLPLRTAEDFSRFVHAIAEGTGWRPHLDKGLMVQRTPHAANVATANEGPPDQGIETHNEYGLSPHHPSYISFFALSGPTSGGETPIVSSLEVYERVKESAPEFLEALEYQGVAFGIHHPVSKIENCLSGESVFSPVAFGPAAGQDISHLSHDERRAIVEANVEALAAEGGWQKGLSEEHPNWQKRGFDALWQPDGSLLAVQRVPGVRTHPVFGVKTLFSNLLSYYLHAEALGTFAPPHHDPGLKLPGGAPFLRPPPYIVGDAADGSKDFVPPREWIDPLEKFSHGGRANVEWQTGDVLLLDNLAVQHGRNPWQGPRKLLASLWDV